MTETTTGTETITRLSKQSITSLTSNNRFIFAAPKTWQNLIKLDRFWSTRRWKLEDKLMFFFLVLLQAYDYLTFEDSFSMTLGTNASYAVTVMDGARHTIVIIEDGHIPRHLMVSVSSRIGRFSPFISSHVFTCSSVTNSQVAIIPARKGNDRKRPSTLTSFQNKLWVEQDFLDGGMWFQLDFVFYVSGFWSFFLSPVQRHHSKAGEGR